MVGIITARTGLPFSVFDYTYDNNGYTIPRLIPPLRSPTTIPVPLSIWRRTLRRSDCPRPRSQCWPAESDAGHFRLRAFPVDMTRRNAFRGPGAWNTDLAIGKNFKVTERVGLEFRAEGFNVFNHHNPYFPSNLYYTLPGGYGITPLPVTALKGGLGSIAIGRNHDERRFGQFSLRVGF